MNKKIWTEDNVELPCPACCAGVLEWNKNVLQSETLNSLINNEYHKNGIIAPDTIFIGSAHLQCSKCSDVVVMTYRRTNDVRNVDSDGYEISIIEPLSYFPAPKIIHIPISCPSAVKELLNQSFALFWIDLNSCGNKIRISVEALMDEFQISGKFLHKRLSTFQNTHAKVANYLMSIKWIGNAGSHISGLNKNAVIDAYELMEYSLQILYNDKEKELDDLSNRINTAKKHL